MLDKILKRFNKPSNPTAKTNSEMEVTVKRADGSLKAYRKTKNGKQIKKLMIKRCPDATVYIKK